MANSVPPSAHVAVGLHALGPPSGVMNGGEPESLASLEESFALASFAVDESGDVAPSDFFEASVDASPDVPESKSYDDCAGELDDEQPTAIRTGVVAKARNKNR
jgi:hypothetical protein